MDRIIYRWAVELTRELEELRREMPDTVYNGSMEDAVAEAKSLLRYIGEKDLEVKAGVIIESLRSMRVRISNSGSYNQPGMKQLVEQIDTFISELKKHVVTSNIAVT
ncbi:MAG: hypothetical protein GSR85_00400 [Desulfurococcales archaeon]|nr:hypothetical protein [Desulfurococcales archaeon]